MTRKINNANAVKVRDALDLFHEREPGEDDIAFFARLWGEHLRKLVIRSEAKKAEATAQPVDDVILTP